MAPPSARSHAPTSKVDAYRQFLARYGCRALCVRVLYAAAKRLIGFRALRGMTLEPDDIDRAFLREVPGLSHCRATAIEFARLPGASELETQTFYEGAARRGDWCWYLKDGDTIASYGWYATAPVPAFDDTSIRFSSEFIYMHRGFTLPEYRGRRLHGHGMAQAAAEAVERGYRGLISFVEAHNAASLRSVDRLGYRTFGTCFRLRLPGKTITYSTPGCRPFGFGLVVDGGPDPAPSPPTPVPSGVRRRATTFPRRRTARSRSSTPR